MLELRYDEKDPDNLRITITNPESGARRAKMWLLQLHDDELAEMPEVDYNTILTMPSQELQRTLKDLMPNGEVVRITCKTDGGRRRVTFGTSGESGELACDLNLSMDEAELEQTEDIDMTVGHNALTSDCSIALSSADISGPSGALAAAALRFLVKSAASSGLIAFTSSTKKAVFSSRLDRSSISGVAACRSLTTDPISTCDLRIIVERPTR